MSASTRRAARGLVAALALAACSITASPTPLPTATVAPTPTPTLAPTLPPTPTPAPTPRFTNAPDAELDALIPATAAGVPVVRAPRDEVAITPGDVGLAYGEVGVRFSSLAVAYTEEPRTTLFAMRVDGDPVATEDLEPYLAEAGRYVGIAGLDPAPWTLADAGGHQVWVRGEDVATAPGTRIYTWSSGEYVFLMIGVSDAVNVALISGLPGEPPAPSPSASAAP